MPAPASRFEDLLARYEPVIGLEVHAQLPDADQALLRLPDRFGALPNTHVCPVCLGHPGALPVLNREAVDARPARVPLALGGARPRAVPSSRARTTSTRTCPRATRSRSTRSRSPTGGIVAIAGADGAETRVRLARIHLEEDAGKLMHEGFPWSDEQIGVDLNRAGVPLIEIVTRARPALARGGVRLPAPLLRAILLYAGVSDGNMEEGSLRCDANVSVRPRGDGAARHARRRSRT